MLVFGFHGLRYFSVYTVKTENPKNPPENRVKTHENRKKRWFSRFYPYM